jgi:predicted O-methyltransferase YrrM
MSFGISAIHLASAVRDNGHGHVVTTELSNAKIAAATTTFAETGTCIYGGATIASWPNGD